MSYDYGAEEWVGIGSFIQNAAERKLLLKVKS